jgi:hypothetical protein
MLENLQRRWGVSGTRLLLILCTFAIGGSLSGIAARQALRLLAIEDTALRIVVYIVLVTLIWPLSVLLVSIPFGQFRFFRNYLARIGSRLSGRKKTASTRPFEQGRK